MKKRAFHYRTFQLPVENVVNDFEANQELYRVARIELSSCSIYHPPHYSGGVGEVLAQTFSSGARRTWAAKLVQEGDQEQPVNKEVLGGRVLWIHYIEHTCVPRKVPENE